MKRIITVSLSALLVLSTLTAVAGITGSDPRPAQVGPAQWYDYYVVDLLASFWW